MSQDESFVPASPEVAQWVERLNSWCKKHNPTSVDPKGMGSHWTDELKKVIEKELKTNSGGIRFNGLAIVGVPLCRIPTLVRAHQDEWRGCHFQGCDFASFSFRKTDLRRAKFSNCSMTGANLQGANFNGSYFINCDLRDCNLGGAELVGAIVIGCILRRADLSGANLENADFHAVDFDAATRLRTLESTKNWQVDRYTIACLTDEAGLTTGNRMDMVIRDDVAELRKQFSGLAGMLHLTSLAVFFAPYLWFLVSHWAQARFSAPTENSISLVTALARYFVNAGVDWRNGFNPNWLPLSISILILAYNAVRFRLLWKTHELEAAERISGVPVRFSMVDPIHPPKWLSKIGVHPFWNWLYHVNRYGYCVYLLLVLYKTFHFLSMRIPIASPDA